MATGSLFGLPFHIPTGRGFLVLRGWEVARLHPFRNEGDLLSRLGALASLPDGTDQSVVKENDHGEMPLAVSADICEVQYDLREVVALRAGFHQFRTCLIHELGDGDGMQVRRSGPAGAGCARFVGRLVRAFTKTERVKFDRVRSSRAGTRSAGLDTDVDLLGGEAES